ncbi:MAG: diphthine--ammonia ligase [Dehalococcoidales bacterium]|nr:diphthine--ammonia ligase [Dehalococcoidales bacterium]
MSYIVSWSGGKESCLALYQALEKGYQISRLVNFVSAEFHRVSFHGTEPKLIQLQSQAIGIPLLQKEARRDEYGADFKETVRSLIPGGVEGMVFGDIYSQLHLDWVEGVCNELGIEVVEPLWGRSTEEVLDSLIDNGFEAIIVSARADLISEDWLGRRVDRAFAEYLKGKDIDPCGEKGEYHTIVVDGPIFQRRIEITETRTIARDGYWFLDTVSYKLSQ